MKTGKCRMCGAEVTVPESADPNPLLYCSNCRVEEMTTGLAAGGSGSSMITPGSGEKGLSSGSTGSGAEGLLSGAGETRTPPTNAPTLPLLKSDPIGEPRRPESQRLVRPLTGSLGDAQAQTSPASQGPPLGPLKLSGEETDTLLPAPAPSPIRPRREAPISMPLPAPARAASFWAALILWIFPIGAGAGIYFARQEPRVQPLVEKLGEQVGRAIALVLEKLRPPEPPPAPPPEAPAVKPAEVKQKSEQDLRELEGMILKKYEGFYKRILEIYAKSGADVFEAERRDADRIKADAEDLTRAYRKDARGREPKLDRKKLLGDFLTDLHVQIAQKERNAKKVRADVAAPLMRIVGRAKQDFNSFLGEYEPAFGPFTIDGARVGRFP